MFLRLSVFISFVLFAKPLSSQVDTLKLYYGINEFNSENNNRRIDSLVSALQGKFIHVKIFGYADFLSSSASNQILSVKRAEGVRDFFIKKMNSESIKSISVKGFGEKKSADNGSAVGDASQRRVDLIVEPFQIMQSNENVIPEKKKN